MKIALTGSSSTGKTTVAKRLMADQGFVGIVGEFITEDARSLLSSLGHQSMDEMSRDELRQFQKQYLNQKATNEDGRSSFLVDRSFVDVAAYWLVRDSYDLPVVEQDRFEERCRELANSYDLHVYFPNDQIPFSSDGYRSENLDFHQRIADKIVELLKDWGSNYISIESPDLDSRVEQILTEVRTWSDGEENLS